LPDDQEDDSKVAAGSRPEDQVNIIKRKSMKSKPGAMKRREALDRTERDRFAKNLAQMAGKANPVTNSTANSVANVPDSSQRWKALRGFIEQTMEKKPEMNAVHR
jgi:hypothetical protein